MRINLTNVLFFFAGNATATDFSMSNGRPNSCFMCNNIDNRVNQKASQQIPCVRMFINHLKMNVKKGF